MSKEKKAQFRLTCIFCGSDKNITKEHLISDWISTEFKDERAIHYERPYRRNPDVSNTFIFDPKRVMQGPIGSIKSRCVCDRCNNTWMSVIVNEAKPYVRALVKRERVEVTSEIKMKLSSWVVLTALVAEHQGAYRNKYRAIAAQERTYMKEHKVPSGKWEIYIAQTNDPDLNRNLAFLNVTMRNEGDISEIPNAFFFYHALEKFIFFARYNNSIFDLKNLYRIRGGLFKIWPIEDSQFPYREDVVLNQYQSNLFFEMFHDDLKYITANVENGFDFLANLGLFN